MAKKSLKEVDDSAPDTLTSKKVKRKAAKAKEQRQQDGGDDTMSRVALLCQEMCWRDAVLLCRKAHAQAMADGKEDTAMSLSMALQKIERSLRRQMAASYIAAAKDMLQKEYLLDVGQ
ncbi:MAG: hypothetical protein GX617_02525 [Lentisphaerae bacterium]|nr:hypothetical protein [Lentisphaerota bacterium]